LKLSFTPDVTSLLSLGFAVAEAIKSRRHEVFFGGKNSGGTTLVYLPIDNWPRRRRGLFPPRRTAGGVRRRRRCCFARMHASAIVHHHRWDAMRCHAMHARLRSCVFSRLSSSRTHRDRARQRHPAAASHTCIALAPNSLARACAYLRARTLFTPVPSDQCCTHSRGVPMHAFPA
jgi:hypothetical protein